MRRTKSKAANVYIPYLTTNKMRYNELLIVVDSRLVSLANVGL